MINEKFERLKNKMFAIEFLQKKIDEASREIRALQFPGLKEPCLVAFDTFTFQYIPDDLIQKWRAEAVAPIQGMIDAMKVELQKVLDSI
jgi:hypothetical protein